MERAAEASVLLCRGGEFHYALHVVELPTHRDHAAPDVLARFLTHKTRVHALGRKRRQTLKNIVLSNTKASQVS